MKLNRQIERAVKRAVLAPWVLIQHGSLRPHRSRVPATGGWIHFDPTDRRAVKKLIYDTARRRVPLPVRVWSDMLEKLEPDFALDIGCNYGECLFGVRYPAGTQGIGCEANPGLIPHLERSHRDHPDRECLELIHALVGEEEGASRELYVDPGWSGTASVVRPSEQDDGRLRSHALRTRRLDTILPPERAERRILLLKMDIEGSEPAAFAGFRETLAAAGRVVGFIEFDTTFMREAGSDGREFFQLLSESFAIYQLIPGKRPRLRRASRFEDLPASRAADGRVHLDLLLVTQDTPEAEWLPDSWRMG